MECGYQVYSSSLERMVPYSINYMGTNYYWFDADCVYYSQYTDEDFLYLESVERLVYKGLAIINNGR